MDKFFTTVGGEKIDLSQWSVGGRCRCDICEKAKEYQKWLRDECEGCEPATPDTHVSNFIQQCRDVLRLCYSCYSSCR